MLPSFPTDKNWNTLQNHKNECDEIWICLVSPFSRLFRCHGLLKNKWARIFGFGWKQRIRMGRMGCVFSFWNLFLTQNSANPSSAWHFSLISWQSNFLANLLSLMYYKKELCCDDLDFVVGMEPCFSCSFCFFEAMIPAFWWFMREGGVFLIAVQERLKTSEIQKGIPSKHRMHALLSVLFLGE